MTPGCSTCGYSVEWLRSCYSGTWRLFNNSSLKTAGYYYFSPPGTPHYPGLHNVWSREWVSDEANNPPLGESTDGHTYRKGGLPIAFPPPVVVGSRDCIRDGDTLPLPVIARSLPAGVDSRCYPAGQVPDPSPALWLRNSSLVPITQGQPLFTWPDSSIFGRDAVSIDVPSSPLVDTLGGQLVADCSVTQYQVLNPPQLPLPGDFAIFVVGFVPTSPKAPSAACIGTVVGSGHLAPMKITATELRSYYGIVELRALAAGNYNALHIWAVRRVGTAYTFYRDGTLLNTIDNGQLSTLNIGTVATTLIQSGGNGQIGLAELQVYDQPLSDAGFASITAALRASYGL